MRYKNFVKKFEQFLSDESSKRFTSVEEKASVIMTLVERSLPKISQNPIKCASKRKYVFFSDGFLRQAEFCCANQIKSTSNTLLTKPVNIQPVAKNTAIVEPQYRNSKKETFISVTAKPTVIPRNTRISTTSSWEEKPSLPYQKTQKDQNEARISFKSKSRFEQVSKVSNILGAYYRPQLPKNRSYAIVLNGSRKVNYPHLRIMTENFPSSANFSINENRLGGSAPITNPGENFLFARGNLLFKGENVESVGPGDGPSRQGRITVMKDGSVHHIPLTASEPI